MRRPGPENGEELLFFSGGTALRELSIALTGYTHNSIHLVTPFDSGGSSARLREAFSMIAIGDLRNRLMSLADGGRAGREALLTLLSTRLPVDGDHEHLARELEQLVAGESALLNGVPEANREVIIAGLSAFAEHKPANFDLRGASLGNLVFVGHYLASDRQILEAIDRFGALVEARGAVYPTHETPLHLAATTAEGELIVGQHRMTGKDEPAITSPIDELYLVDSLDHPSRASAQVSDKTRAMIGSAALIAYPMGSFYTSIIANLLPDGVGSAIVGAPCPKVYIPSTGVDPEQLGMSVADSVATIIEYVRRDAGADAPTRSILSAVILDESEASYERSLELERILELGIEVHRAPLVTEASSPRVDANSLAELLLTVSAKARRESS